MKDSEFETWKKKINKQTFKKLQFLKSRKHFLINLIDSISTMTDQLIGYPDQPKQPLSLYSMNIKCVKIQWKKKIRKLSVEKKSKSNNVTNEK